MSELSKHERRVKLGPDSLPPVGAIYGVPLRDGRFGACKVVAVRLPSDPGLESPERCFAVLPAEA